MIEPVQFTLLSILGCSWEMKDHKLFYTNIHIINYYAVNNLLILLCTMYYLSNYYGISFICIIYTLC